jgi:hypothetical protein
VIASEIYGLKQKVKKWNCIHLGAFHPLSHCLEEAMPEGEETVEMVYPGKWYCCYHCYYYYHHQY